MTQPINLYDIRTSTDLKDALTHFGYKFKMSAKPIEYLRQISVETSHHTIIFDYDYIEETSHEPQFVVIHILPKNNDGVCISIFANKIKPDTLGCTWFLYTTLPSGYEESIGFVKMKHYCKYA